MPRVLAIDYGKKRVGLAISDPNKIIANELKIISPDELINFIKQHLSQWQLDTIILGHPKDLKNRDTHLTKDVEVLFAQLQNIFPTLQIRLVDERFTSKMATHTLHELNLPKKKKHDKKKIDQISALILLQEFLNYN